MFVVFQPLLRRRRWRWRWRCSVSWRTWGLSIEPFSMYLLNRISNRWKNKNIKTIHTVITLPTHAFLWIRTHSWFAPQEYILRNSKIKKETHIKILTNPIKTKFSMRNINKLHKNSEIFDIFQSKRIDEDIYL